MGLKVLKEHKVLEVTKVIQVLVVTLVHKVLKDLQVQRDLLHVRVTHT
jgi:hypothetical protein